VCAVFPGINVCVCVKRYAERGLCSYGVRETNLFMCEGVVMMISGTMMERKNKKKKVPLPDLAAGILPIIPETHLRFRSSPSSSHVKSHRSGP
jgi:hypothetical protein